MRTLTLTALLLALPLVCRADDVDPEPPGGSAVLRKLQGEWQAVRRIRSGKETAFDKASYTFKKDRVTAVMGKGTPREMKFKPDSKRPDAFALDQGNAKMSGSHFIFKIEKGELYLLPVTFATKADKKPDFSGNKAPVIVFKKVE